MRPFLMPWCRPTSSKLFGPAISLTTSGISFGYVDFRPDFISATQQQALASVLRPLMSNNGILGVVDSEPEVLAWKFVLHNEEAVKEVKRLLKTAALGWDAVLARAMTFDAENFERIDRMCMTAEARRDAALREIDRHREGFGQRLRRAINRVEDAEFRVIEPPVDCFPYSFGRKRQLNVGNTERSERFEDRAYDLPPERRLNQPRRNLWHRVGCGGRADSHQIPTRSPAYRSLAAVRSP